jgi:hypothetical protein
MKAIEVVDILNGEIGPACTTGYAITRNGARKLLYNIGYLGPTDPVDLQLLQLCARESGHNPLLRQNLPHL